MWNTCDSNFCNRSGCNFSYNRYCGCSNNSLFNLLFGNGTTFQTVCRDCNGNLRVQRSSSCCGCQSGCASNWNNCGCNCGCWNVSNASGSDSATFNGLDGGVNLHVSCSRLGNSTQTTSNNGDACCNRQRGYTGRCGRSSYGCGCNE